jgi:hypothetical protein
MLGIRRPGVTEACGQLKEAGLISYRRGDVTIVDRAGLEAVSCECYAQMKKEHTRMVGADGHARQVAGEGGGIALTV